MSGITDMYDLLVMSRKVSTIYSSVSVLKSVSSVNGD